MRVVGQKATTANAGNRQDWRNQDTHPTQTPGKIGAIRILTQRTHQARLAHRGPYPTLAPGKVGASRALPNAGCQRYQPRLPAHLTPPLRFAPLGSAGSPASQHRGARPKDLPEAVKKPPKKGESLTAVPFFKNTPRITQL